jgi:hypothetical protein
MLQLVNTDWQVAHIDSDHQRYNSLGAVVDRNTDLKDEDKGVLSGSSWVQEPFEWDNNIFRLAAWPFAGVLEWIQWDLHPQVLWYC